ncbi:MAG: nucleoside 2-deoxyribosyltransferase [Nitrosomonas sp.]|nr:nucleoside 2-deoxyribosyltransferase [Nitrosomonas sp.]
MDGSIQFQITAKGWSRISELQNKPNKESNQAFVAMWFNNKMNSYYQSIKEAIELDGTQCIRIDSEQHNNKICDEIIAQIRKSKYLVADFTGNRGGVYFEAGFALGLGIPVIWMVRNDYLKKIHFDTRQYNHIVYKTEADLKQQLIYRIQATII